MHDLGAGAPPPLLLRPVDRKPPTPLPVPINWRCWGCDALLGEYAVNSVARVKCWRCRAYNVVDTRAAA
jgi:hypothetical protein